MKAFLRWLWRLIDGGNPDSDNYRHPRWWKR